MTIKHLDDVATQPASDHLIEELAKCVLDMRAHEHYAGGLTVDIFCLNLKAYVGERIAPVLVRLREAEAALQRVRDMHPKTENPTHGCCAPPKLCEGHPAECRSDEHGLNVSAWPCNTLRAIDGPAT